MPVIPCWTAQIAAALREATPSLLMILATWLETVWGLMNSTSAISWLVRASTSSFSTSTSRGESPAAAAADGAVLV